MRRLTYVLLYEQRDQVPKANEDKTGTCDCLAIFSVSPFRIKGGGGPLVELYRATLRSEFELGKWNVTGQSYLLRSRGLSALRAAS